MSKKVDYWLELSDYDLQTAAVMLDGRRFLYVGFMAHQSVEKILKAYFVKNSNDKTPPHSHRLSLLAKKASLYSTFSESQKNFIDILEPMNIESRYPSNAGITQQPKRDLHGPQISALIRTFSCFCGFVEKTIEKNKKTTCKTLIKICC